MLEDRFRQALEKEAAVGMAGDDLDDLEDPVGPGRRPRDVLERDVLLPRPRREAM